MLISVLGDRRSALAPGWHKETVIALAGEVELDVSAGADRGAVITCFGLFGDLKLRVPPGTRVTQHGLSLGGDSDAQLTPAGDGPEVAVKVYGLLTDVEITDQPR